MCNIDCFQWAAKNLISEDIKGKKVIEVGSCNVNGSLRYLIEMLEPEEYIGVDIVEGPGVDIICPAEKLVEKFGKDSFDVIVSTCVLEHIRDWKSSVSNIKNICKSGGTILIFVPSRWPFHEYPYDFWRYKKEDIQNIFSDCEILALDEDFKKKSLVYAKIKKPEKFLERDLSDYLLYSVIVNKKISEIIDRDLKSFRFKYLILKINFLNSLIKFGSFILEKI